MHYSYRIEIVIDGKRRGIVLNELCNVVRPIWDGVDYYTVSAQAVWDALEALPNVEMVTPRLSDSR